MSLIRGNALAVPLADESVDLIVTSPPYFALRSYTDGGEHYDGQIGSEATPADFIAALLEVTRECVRVLKPSGSLWVNLGDKYVGGGQGGNVGGNLQSPNDRVNGEAARQTYGLKAKSLMGLPWRYALGCIDDLGLILRAEVIWSKPNGLPESVQDRVRRSHEQWFHFTKEPRYYSAVDEIREAQVQTEWTGRSGCNLPGVESRDSNDGLSHRAVAQQERVYNPLGKLPGSVWTIDSQLWLDGPIAFCPRCGRDLRGAGSGPGGSTPKATATTGSRVTGSAGSTESPTSSGSARSVKDSPSTTSAGSATASTRTTSKRSRSGSTSSGVTPPQPGTEPRPLASTGTTSPTPTPTSEATDGESAACVCETGCVVGGQGSVWQIPTEPLRVPDHLPQHFAAFPSEWPRRIILGWSPSGVCVKCGEGRRPVVDRRFDGEPNHAEAARQRQRGVVSGGIDNVALGRTGEIRRTITGESCACPTPDAPTRPAIILDPFAGTGTSVAVANALGRHGIGLDLSADYLKLARWRCQDPGLRAKVLGVDKPKPEVTGQLALGAFG